MKTVIDGRKLTHKHLEEIRYQAIDLRIKGGMKIKEIARKFGLWPSCISNWIATYKKFWKQWLKAKTGKPWRKRALNDQEIKKLGQIILYWPRWAMLDYGLRTVRLIKMIIKKKFKKDLHETTVKRLLNDMWFSNQKPLYQAFQKNPEVTAERVKNVLPKIEEEAKKEWREIRYWDEAGIRSNNHRGKTRGKKGETPIVLNNGVRFWLNSISVINNKGELRFMCYEWSFVVAIFLTFLKRLLYKNTKKITLILDGHRVHKAKAVMNFIAKTNWQIKVYYLPPYSPELNPDELVWNDLKNWLKQVTITGKKDLKKRVKQNLHRLQKEKEKVRSFFRKK